MGNRQSGDSAVECLPEVIQITQQIEEVRQKLDETKLRGRSLRLSYDIERREVEKEQFKKQKLYVQAWKRIWGAVSYFEYLGIMQRVYSDAKHSPLLSPVSPSHKRTAETASGDNTNVSETSTDDTHTLIVQNYLLGYHVWSFWEAFLLRKTHVAMIQKHQQKIYNKGLSRNVTKLSDEFHLVEENFSEVHNSIKEMLEEEKSKYGTLREAYKSHAGAQKRLIQNLSNLPESKNKSNMKGTRQKRKINVQKRVRARCENKLEEEKESIFGEVVSTELGKIECDEKARSDNSTENEAHERKIEVGANIIPNEEDTRISTEERDFKFQAEGSFKSSRPKADKEEVIVGESIGREENQERLEKEEQEMLEHEDINRNSGDSQILEKVEADGQIERVAGSQSTNYDDALTMTNAANIESQARSKEGEREGSSQFLEGFSIVKKNRNSKRKHRLKNPKKTNKKTMSSSSSVGSADSSDAFFTLSGNDFRSTATVEREKRFSKMTKEEE